MKIDRYNELMLSTKDVAYRVALSLVGNAADAEDVTQDIYEMVWRRRDEILNMGNPPRLCSQIGQKSLSRSFPRRRQTRPLLDGHRTRK